MPTPHLWSRPEAAIPQRDETRSPKTSRKLDQETARLYTGSADAGCIIGMGSVEAHRGRRHVVIGPHKKEATIVLGVKEAGSDDTGRI